MCLTNNIVFHTIHYGINNDNTKIYHMNTPKKPPSCGRLAEAAASAGVPTERAGRWKGEAGAMFIMVRSTLPSGI